MRIAFLSDIHSNLQAWTAVKADLSTRRVDQLICLGDVVGYGPSPVEVLNQVYAHVDGFVLGNHDAVVAGHMDAEGFNDKAKALIEWTTARLDQKAARFFEGLPLALCGSGWRACHGTPASTDAFGYLLKEKDARAAWKAVDEPLLFVGHTHTPRLHVLGRDGGYQRFHCGEKQVALKAGARYIINAGSVGMDRAGSGRANYVILDTTKKHLSWHKVPFDVDTFCQTVEARLPTPELAAFVLNRFRPQQTERVRESLDFSPGRSPIARKVCRERHVRALRRRVAHWQLAAVASLAGLLLALCALFLYKPVASGDSSKSIALRNDSLKGLLLAGGARQATVVECVAGSGSKGLLPAGWQARLGEGEKQSVCYDGTSLSISSAVPDAWLELSAPPVALKEVERLQVRLSGFAEEDVSGQLPVLHLDYRHLDGSLEQSILTEPLVRQGGKLSKKKTLSRIPDSVRSVQLRLVGRFVGTVGFDSLGLVANPPRRGGAGSVDKVPVNSAGVKDLTGLPGIGESLAGRIVASRKAEGPFRNKTDLVRVQGVGPVLAEELAPLLSFE